MATQDGLQVYGTQLSFADHAADFDNGTPSQPVTAANSLIIGTPTEVQMNLSVVANAAMWQSAKTATLAKTGSAWPIMWRLGACLEFTATPAADTTCEFYWNPSPSATPATGNSGGTSGTDLAYTAVGTKQLILIGVMTLRNAVINIDNRIGWLRMPDLYGSLIFVNKSGVAMVADGDADEIHVTLTPVIDNLQAAA